MSRARTAGVGNRAVVPVVALLLVAAVVVAVRALPQDTTYHVQLTHASGLRTGDAVRVAGLDVGTVTSIEVEGTVVAVDLALEDAAPITEDTTAEVKMLSLLGDRYLALEPGDGEELEAGGTLPVEQAVDSYPLERVFLDATPEIEALDLDVMEQAIDTLTTDLSVRSGDLGAALDGLTQVAGIVTDRDEQLGRLLRSTESVTDLVLDQQDELETLMDDADLVMSMVVDRREAIRLLLRDARALVVELTDLVRANADQLAPALRQARTVLRVITHHEQELDRTLELAGPAMRMFTNATGDGPWLGVNAPYFVFPDDMYCLIKPGECS